ncbi:hypothetical protein GCM10027258_44600 [Amycolatopsis stemonae]
MGRGSARDAPAVGRRGAAGAGGARRLVPALGRCRPIAKLGVAGAIPCLRAEIPLYSTAKDPREKDETDFRE